uniref:Putative secreted protein n=1 Tax=Amblyomma triste TaxID=251400 RepID=A0A023G6N7_AMBTT
MAVLCKPMQGFMLIALVCLVFSASVKGHTANIMDVTATFNGGGCNLNGEAMKDEGGILTTNCIFVHCDGKNRKVIIKGCPPTEEDKDIYNGDQVWPKCCSN